jgi:hypothetical protein
LELITVLMLYISSISVSLSNDTMKISRGTTSCSPTAMRSRFCCSVSHFCFLFFFFVFLALRPC